MLVNIGSASEQLMLVKSQGAICSVFDIVTFIANNYVIIYFRSVLGGVFFNSCV